MNSEYSLSDIAAVNGNHGGMWGGDWSAWIIIFLIFAAFGYGGNGGFFGGGNNSGAADNYVLASDFATIQRQLSDGFGGVEKGIDTIRNGLCDGFYTEAQLINGVNMNIAQNGYESRLATQTLGSQLASCCCDIRTAIANSDRQVERGFADTNYNLATQNCATLSAIDKVGDRIIDYISSEKMQTLRDENQALRLAASQAAQNTYLINQLRPCPTPAYITCNPFSSCNCNSGCGSF